jgi:hypothetical protein
MSVASLRLDLGDAPRSEAAKTLVAMLANRAAMAERADAVDVRQGEAVQRRDAAAIAVAQLERRAAGGEDVSQGERTKAEKTLSEARAQADAPWAERRAGAIAAVGDLDDEIKRFIAANLDELVDELREDGKAAAESVDAACRALIDGYQHRMLVEQRLTSLLSMVRIPRVGDVTRTKADGVVAEANRLLESGGEQAPVMRVDPRAPRHGQAVADVEHVLA